MKFCKECGKEIPDRLNFCSRSCATRYNNKLRVANGTCNLLKENGGSELAKKHNKEMMEQGIHPFAKGNFSEITRMENGIKHSKWVKENQVAEGRHPWQIRESRINNECAREQSIYNTAEIKDIYLYISSVPDIPNVIKIGVTRDLGMRQRDGRFPIENPIPVLRGNFSDVTEIERDIKLKFSSDESFSKYESYEILDATREDIISEIQRLSKSRSNVLNLVE